MVSSPSSGSGLFLWCYRDHRDLHSFPTRRSSDLLDGACMIAYHHSDFLALETFAAEQAIVCERLGDRCGLASAMTITCSRSEEHTSELQSHSDLVCRLLLEKKKTHRKEAAMETAV